MLAGFCLSLALLSLPAAGSEPIRVTGRVLAMNATGSGVGLAGARVELFPAYEEDGAALLRLKQTTGPKPLASARTNAEGSFEPLAPGSGGFRVAVQAEGYMPAEIPFLALVEDTELLPTNLVPGDLLEARILGVDGQALAGIEVRLTEPPAPQRWREEEPFYWRLGERRGVSGTDGRLTLPVFDQEPAALTAVSPAFLGLALSRSPGAPATFRLGSRRTVTVEVRDGEGQPVPDALLRWRGRALAASGPDGRLRVAVPGGGEPSLMVSRRGWTARITKPPVGEAGVLPVRLQPPRRISGKVVDAVSGRPVAGALVWSGWPLLAPVATTNAEGAFHLAVPAGEEAWLQAAAAGFFRGDRQSVGPEASSVLKLAPAAALSGVVVDSAGRPLAGVKIAAYSSRVFSMPLDRAGAQTRGDGEFRLRGLRPSALYELTATGEGFGRTTLAVRTSSAGRASAPIRLVMRAGTTAFGRVEDEAGQPVTGAEVTLTDRAGMVFKATSRDDGSFELYHLEAGRCDLLAKGRGYAYAVRTGIEIPGGETAVDLGTVTLPAGAAVEGRVSDTRGSPIENAEIGVSPASTELRGGALRGDLLESVKTESDGRFRVEGLRRGERYDLSAAHQGYATALAPGVRAPTRDPVRIELKMARSIAGRVIGPAGEPIAGAFLNKVESLRFGTMMSTSSSSLGSTDPGGLFRLTGLAAGTIDLEVAAEGYETRKVEGLQIPEGRDLEGVEITLQHGTWLEVQVLDTAGEPVGGAMVDARAEKPQDLSSFHLGGFDQTDERGRCRLSVTGTGVYRVTARKDFREASARVTAGSGSPRIVLHLATGVEVSGRVLGAEGDAAPRAWVDLKTAEQRGTAVPVAVDGTFVFSEVPDGDYLLKAQTRGGKVSAPLEFRVAGRPVRGLELRLDREDDRATLSGRILGLSPEELARVTVAAWPMFPGTDNVTGKASPGGEYRIERLDPGQWMVRAATTESRMVTKRIQIEPGATEATLDLEFPEGGLTLSGRVFLDGAPLVGASVAVAKQRGIDLVDRSQTAWDGGFTLGDLQPGSTTLIIFNLSGLFNMSGLAASRSLELTESQEVVIELASGRLRGLVVAPSGAPVEDATASVGFSIPGMNPKLPVATLHSGPDGTFQSPRLIAGMYLLTVEKEGFAPEKLTVEVPAGNETELEIPLRPLSSP